MDLQDEIRRLAYEIYERTGCLPGRCVDNWLEAERVILTEVIIIDETPGAVAQVTAAKPAKPKKTAKPQEKKPVKKTAGATRKSAASPAKGKTARKKT